MAYTPRRHRHGLEPGRQGLLLVLRRGRLLALFLRLLVHGPVCGVKKLVVLRGCRKERRHRRHRQGHGDVSHGVCDGCDSSPCHWTTAGNPRAQCCRVSHAYCHQVTQGCILVKRSQSVAPECTAAFHRPHTACPRNCTAETLRAWSARRFASIMDCSFLGYAKRRFKHASDVSNAFPEPALCSRCILSTAPAEESPDRRPS